MRAGGIASGLAVVVIAAAPSASAAGDLVDLADTRPVAKIAGAGSVNQTELRWNVWGTDLGSMFEYDGRVYMTFGDTYGEPQESDLEPTIPPPDPNTQENAGATTRLDHRSNVMAFFGGGDPAAAPLFDGMIEDRPGHAMELLDSRKVKGDEQTVIPTYGIAVGDRMYLHYMSVREFGPAPYYTLNHSGLAYSDDGGQSWVKDPFARWPGCCDPATTGSSGFGQVAIVRENQYLYFLGVPGGRWGGVKLARVPAAQILSLPRYRYWDGASFGARSETSAVEIVPPMTGELSVAWNSHYRKWLMLYADGDNGNVAMRTAECLVGPWSDEQFVIPPEAGVPYGPMLPPRWNNGRDIWFAVSLYSNYGVWWWHTSLLGEPRGQGPERCIAP